MKAILLNYSFVMLLLLFGASYANAQVPELVNPYATQKTKDVYSYIYNAKYKGLITGQHNYAQTWLSNSETAIRASRLVQETTGEWPGLWGSDFSFTDPNYTIDQLQQARRRMIEVAKDQANSGSLITLTYHMVTPKLEENQGWENVQQARLTMEEYEELVTPGTDLYNNWKRNMDRVIPFLKELEDEDIVVIWRPYHEMNGLFWWGGGESAKVHFNQLWINTYDYMVNNPDPSLRLNNLIWFWSPNHFTSWNNDRVPTPWFPGLQYVDMLGIDDYWWTQEGFLSQGDYDYLVELAKGKPLAIGEGFNPNMVIPDPEWMMKNRPEYRWFMLWDGQWINDRINDPIRREALTEIYHHENAINQDRVYIPALDIVDDTPPSIPENLQVQTLEWNSIALEWEESTDENGVSGYEIFINGEYEKFTFDNFTTIKNLAPETEYSITIKSRDHYMNRSQESEPLIVLTPVFEPSPPTIPLNLTLMGRSESSISLKWEPSESNATITGYNIYLDEEFHSKVLTPYTSINELGEGYNYKITVKGVNEFDQVSESSEVLEVSTYEVLEETVSVNDSEFTYTGTWGRSTGSGKYMGDDHWSRTRDAFYTYTFIGTKAYVFASKAPHHGIAAISINNGDEVLVDYYSPFRIDETIVYETPELPMGIHIIKVRVTGTRNPDSSGEVIAADRLDYLSGELQDDIPPSVPTGIIITDRTFHTVSLQWNASIDNTSVFGYHIYIDNNKVLTSQDTTATITGLSPLTTYQISIKAFDGFENVSEASEPIEVTTLSSGEVNLVQNGSFEYDLMSWTGLAGNVKINTEFVAHGTKSLEVGPTAWSWLQQTVQGWETGQKYRLIITARTALAGQEVRVALKTRYPGAGSDTDLIRHTVNTAEFIEYSGDYIVEEGVTWLQVYMTNRGTSAVGYIDNIRLILVDEEAPTVPTSLILVERTPTTLSILFDPSTDNVAVEGYEIYVDGVLRMITNDNYAVISNLEQGTKYLVYVRAFDGAGNFSEQSETMIVQTVDIEAPSVPSGLKVEEKTQNSISIKWEEAVDNVGISGYNVYLDGELFKQTEDLEAQLTGLLPNTTYFISISAFDEEGNESQKSEVLVAKTLENVLSETLGNGNVLKIFPNPFEHELIIKIVENEPINGNVNYFIQDVSGRIVRQGVLKRKDGFTHSIETNNMKSGLYILRLMGKTQHSTLIKKK